MGLIFAAQLKAEKDARRIAEATRLNAVEARRCPFCFRYKAASVALHEQHERRCLRSLWKRLQVDRLKRREDLRDALKRN